MRRGSKMGGEKKEKHSFYSVFLFFAYDGHAVSLW